MSFIVPTHILLCKNKTVEEGIVKLYSIFYAQTEGVDDSSHCHELCADAEFAKFLYERFRNGCMDICLLHVGLPLHLQLALGNESALNINASDKQALKDSFKACLMRVRDEYQRIISQSVPGSEHDLYSEGTEFIPSITVGGILQQLIYSEILKLQEIYPNLNLHAQQDILIESRRVSPYTLSGQDAVQQQSKSIMAKSSCIDSASSNGFNSTFVVSSSSELTQPSSIYDEKLSRSVQSFISPYQYLVMNPDGTVGATESVSYPLFSPWNSEPLSPPVVLDVISWPELSERFGSLPLDANTSGRIRQILGANVKQIYRTVHKSVLPLNTYSDSSAWGHEGDIQSRLQQAERAYRMKIYGSTVQHDASQYSAIISKAVATMAIGLQASESNTSEILKVLLFRKDLIPTFQVEADDVPAISGGVEVLSNAGDEESNSAANSVNNKDIVTAKKRKFRKTSDCRRRDLRTTKEEAVEHVEDDSTKSFRDMLSEPVCRSESFALGDVLLSRRTRTFKRHALLLAQSDYCDSQRIDGIMTTRLRAKEQIVFRDMLPRCTAADNNNNNNNNDNEHPSPSSSSSQQCHDDGSNVHVLSAGPSDADLFHTHQSFRNILFGCASNQDKSKKSSAPVDDDIQDYYPDTFSNRVHLYGLHQTPQLLEDHSNGYHSHGSNDKKDGGGATKRRKLFNSYLNSEDLDVVDDESYSQPTTPCLSLLEHIQYMANIKFASRVIRNDPSSIAPQPLHNQGDNSENENENENENDSRNNWTVLKELFDPTALIAIAVVVEELCKEMMFEWHNRGTIADFSSMNSLRVELSAQLNGRTLDTSANSPSSSSSSSSPSSLDVVHGIVKALFGNAVACDEDVKLEVEKIHREFFSSGG